MNNDFDNLDHIVNEPKQVNADVDHFDHLDYVDGDHWNYADNDYLD